MREIRRILFVLAGLTVLGTLGFWWIEEDWSLLDCMYMTVITLTTVGFGEVHPLSSSGQVFTMIFLVLGLGVFMFGIVQVGELVVRAELGDWVGRRKNLATLKTMKNHYIVCGFGRFGRLLCEELAEHNRTFVVIDREAAALEVCKDRQWPFLVGDAIEDSMLQDAGIDRARGIACALADDANNLYAVLSARLLNKDIQIISRASSEKDAAKLRRAGADRVISLYATAATKMAQLMANPHVEDFMELVTARGKELDLTEVQVVEEAPYAGISLAAAGFRERGVMIVGIRRRDGELVMPTEREDVPQVGDSLIALGKVAAIQELLQGG